MSIELTLCLGSNFREKRKEIKGREWNGTEEKWKETIVYLGGKEGKGKDPKINT